MKYLSIPSTVKSIGSWFLNGTSDINIKCFINPPINLPDLVVPKNATLYVPYGSKSLYEQVSGWKDFPNIIEMEYVGLKDISVDSITTKGIYTIDGVKLEGVTYKEVPKGIYIIDGKKVQVR